MFGLYEIVKCLTVKNEDTNDHSILNYAWREAGEVNFTALVSSTGSIGHVLLCLIFLLICIWGPQALVSGNFFLPRYYIYTRYVTVHL